jgi:hypothetical protein
MVIYNQSELGLNLKSKYREERVCLFFFHDKTYDLPVHASQIIVVQLNADHNSYLEKINVEFHHIIHVQQNSYRLIMAIKEIEVHRKMEF